MYPIKMAKKYDPADLAATGTLYTTVYLGTYVDGDFTEWNGSHLGVDMIPSRSHDEVVSILDGVVVTAAVRADSGNYVIIKHENVPDPDDASRKTTLYSCYLHLDTYVVAAGAIVSEGQKIGTTGTTGNSSGEHLHFQIDRADAPYHPFWPYSMAEAQSAGLTFTGAVNAGLGLEKAKRYTVNPLVYLDRIGRGFGGTAPAHDAHVPVTPATGPVANGPDPDAAIVDPTPGTGTIASGPDPDQPIIGASTTPTTTAVAGVSIRGDKIFQDVAEGDRYAASILALKDRGIVAGTGGYFYPSHNVSRAELLKMVFLAGNIPLESVSAAPFEDVPTTQWYAPYVATAKKRGIVGGFPDGTFHPNNPITRAEALKVIVGTLAPERLPISAGAPFSDVAAGEWYAPYAELAKDAGLMVFADGRFEPNKFISRAESANAVATLS